MRKKLWLIGIVAILVVVITSGFSIVKNKSNVSTEKELSFKYFQEQTNWNENSLGYGLVRDRYPGSPNVASLAATGFGLSAIPIGVEEGWITKEEGKKRAEKTLDTILAMENIEGFFFHFVNMETGKREWGSELSNIDTAILVCGALEVGEYFGETVKEKATKIYEAINWNWFVDPSNNQFYMSYAPEKGFSGHWDFYAEQLMLYVLGAGSPTYPINKNVYNSFTKHVSKYGQGENFIHSWFGSLFTYQFSHAWIDFRNINDDKGINWFDNSVVASKANYDFCKDQGENFKTFKDGGWGITACDTPTGYDGLIGAPPSGYDNKSHKVEGTVAPAGAIGSIVFTPEESKKALDYYYSIDGLVGEYGLKDAYNLDKNWVANDYIGIDKGITLLMLQNYENQGVWNNFMKNEYVKKGLDNLNFSKK